MSTNTRTRYSCAAAPIKTIDCRTIRPERTSITCCGDRKIARTTSSPIDRLFIFKQRMLGYNVICHPKGRHSGVIVPNPDLFFNRGRVGENSERHDTLATGRLGLTFQVEKNVLIAKTGNGQLTTDAILLHHLHPRPVIAKVFAAIEADDVRRRLVAGDALPFPVTGVAPAR